MKKYRVQPLDLMQYINTKYHEPFIHEKIELDGSLDTERFAKSLDTLANLFPLLKCQYDSKENAFVEQKIQGHDLFLVADDKNITSFLAESLDMGKNLIRFTLLGSTLIITVSHLVCDGVGFKQLIYLLCDIYNGSCECSGSNLMNRDFSQLTQVLEGGSGTVQMLLSMLRNYKNKPIYERSNSEDVYIIEKTISNQVMERIHAAAKGQGATLNDVFLAAYARAISRQCGLTKVNIPCTVDLRKYAKGETGIANLTGTYNLNIKFRDGETFSETLLSVSENMKRQKRTRNDIAGPRLLVSKYDKSSLEKFLRTYGGMNTSAFTDYTNLGVLDEQRLCFHGVSVKNATGYSGLNKAPCFQIAISTFRGATTISSLFQCGEHEAEKADNLMEMMVSELRSFVQ